MRSSTIVWALTLALSLTAAHAQDLTGQWQGTLRSRDLRFVLQFSKGTDNQLTGVFYSVGRTPDGVPVDAITLKGSTLDFIVREVNGRFEGTLNKDGNMVSGTWIQVSASPLTLERATKETAWPTDISPHTVRYVTVQKDIKVEVLDWGGTGPPLVLLPGGGDTAHVFDSFAPKFTASHHVYGITRRGFGKSTHPLPTVENFNAERLGDDVLAVINALKLHKPVLAGHSIAGEELSSVCSRDPEKVAGLIYLDAALGFAFYSGHRGAMSVDIDLNELRRELDLLKSPQSLPQLKATVRQLLQAGLPDAKGDLEDWQRNLQSLPDTPAASNAPPLTYRDEVNVAIAEGEQKYTKLNCPILAIFAWPSNVTMTAVVQAHALETAMPSAHVVRVPNASHYVYRTNEAQVEREMKSFMSSLQKTN